MRARSPSSCSGRITSTKETCGLAQLRITTFQTSRRASVTSRNCSRIWENRRVWIGSQQAAQGRSLLDFNLVAWPTHQIVHLVELMAELCHSTFRHGGVRPPFRLIPPPRGMT